VALALDSRRESPLLTIGQAAALAGVHRNTIRAWCQAGRLPSVRVNHRGDRRLRRADIERLVSARALATPSTGLSIVREPVTRTGALHAIAAEVAGQLDLDALFEDVLDHAESLFGADKVGLWRIEDRPHPFRLAAHRGLSPELTRTVARFRATDESPGIGAIRARTIKVIDRRQTSNPAIARIYRRDGIRTACFVPILFRDEPLGMLALYHGARHAWPPDELELARAFADQMAVAIKNAQLYESVQAQAARLTAIRDLTLRLNRISDIEGIGRAIVAEARTLIDHDTIRVYRVDHAAGTCEPIAFQGVFMGVEEPTPEMLRVPVGEGLTGWAAAHNETIRLGDAAADPRRLFVGRDEGPESMLLVPMSHDDRVVGVIVASKLGRDRFSVDDETTLSIFAGHAAQALVNAEHLEQVRRQQAELEHQLASQRRLLEVNERLLSTLDPGGILEMIADSLKTVVAYDSLTIYRVDRERGVRRAMVARDRFADLILQYEGPLGVGITGWAIDHGEAVLANDGHLDPRSVQIPGTPFEPESMIVVPLGMGGEVIGTLNVGRMGEAEAHFSQNEFELTKLFAGQASIALQNAEAHGAVMTRADHDALTGLRNHGTFQRELGAAIAASDGSPFAVLMMDLDGFKAYNDSYGHPVGDELLREVAGALRGAIRDGDRIYRYGGDEFAVILPGATRTTAFEVSERIRRAVASVDRPVGGARISISVGAACFPDDGRTKDELVTAADQALYLVKPSRVGPADTAASSRDTYLAALNETALALMDRLDPTELLETIIARATGLMGTPDGFIYLLEPDQGTLVLRVGTGAYTANLGRRIAMGEGLSGLVVRTGRAQTVEDYDAWDGRVRFMPAGVVGSIVAVPLTSGSKVIGVIGLSSGGSPRTFDEREIAVLERFAQLASIALDNARLFEAAQRQVTERARAEDALRASEERFRLLSDATVEALAIHRDGQILEVNQAFCRLFGYAPDELLGRSVLELAAPESRDFILAQIAARPQEPYEAFGLTRDGTVFPAELAGRNIAYSDGQPARVTSVRDLR
jgi:diguanylate cyclase (GGDEF)-like protein/PAS domain S-box-containing protein/excisionase family DNA binding protein